MNGTASSSSNHSATASSRIDGANGPKDLPPLDLGVEDGFHVARGADRTGSSGCRARAAPTPCAPETSRRPCPSAIAAAARRQSSLSSAISSTSQPRAISARRVCDQIGDFAVGECRPPIGMVHDKGPAAAELVPDRKGRADRAAGIAGGGLDVNASKRRHPPDLAVGDRVHRAAAGQRDIRQVHNARCSAPIRWKNASSYIACTERAMSRCRPVERLLRLPARPQQLLERRRKQIAGRRSGNRPSDTTIVAA